MIMKVLTSATVWEFVSKVSRLCDLAPIYVDIVMSNGENIKVTDYGKTLADLGFKNGEKLIVRKNGYED
jgi:hypothetical protein